MRKLVRKRVPTLTLLRRKRRLLGLKQKPIVLNPKPTNWLDRHLETFVKPVLGTTEPVAKTGCEDAYIKTLVPEVLQHLVDTWNEIKKYAGNRRILLPGRDAYFFEILAQMEGNDMADFRPDLNSSTKAYFNAELKKKYKDHFAVDSGLVGSIPMALDIKDFRLVLYNTSDNGGKKQHQIFPGLNNLTTTSPHYQLYCALEGSSKYWNRASPNGYASEFAYSKSHVTEFTNAARITIHICKFLLSKECKNFKVKWS